MQSRAPIAGILAVSAAACVFLFWLVYFREPEATTTWVFLPALNASMNGCASIALVAGFIAIRRGRVGFHRSAMSAAFVFSTLFLVGYIAHHALHGDTKFAGQGPIKIVYLSILASHVILSIGALPMVLMTFFFSISGQFRRHRSLARYTFPIWLYVSVTGVVVFFMLRAVNGS